MAALALKETFFKRSGRLPSPWAEAAADGKLTSMPSNAQLDGIIASGVMNTFLFGGWWWTSSMIAFPAPGERIARRSDIKDSDSSGREWVLPAKCIPEQAFWVQGAAIFIDMPQITLTNDRAVIEAGEMTVIRNFIQDEQALGIVHDPKTMAPRSATEKELLHAAESEKRGILRRPAEGVRPIARICTGNPEYMNYVSVKVDHLYALNIAELDRAKYDHFIDSIKRLKRGMGPGESYG